MLGIRTFWNSGLVGKIVLIGAGVVGLFSICCVVLVVAGLFVTPASTTGTAPSPVISTALAVAESTIAPAPTAVPEPTSIPVATEPPPTEVPSAAPEPTNPPPPSPSPTPEPNARYVAIAQDGAIPVVRTGLPAGEWKASTLIPGEVQITYPLTVGFSNEQIVRLGKTQAQGIIKRLFGAAPELESVNTVGTLPDGPNNAEVPAIAIVVKRDDLKTWDGTPDTIGHWNISQRLR